MNHIELFAGCGGLSLGLESVGFELLLANEISPMAAETFAFNFFNENLLDKAEKQEKPENALWVSSQFQDLKPRLRENPFQYPSLGEGFNDFETFAPHQLKGKMLVGDIKHINQLLEQKPELRKSISNAFNGTSLGVDLISGGPPCQSFSMAGMRKKDCDKNSLPWEFAKFVEHVQPKIALLENVTGILRPFADDDGKKYHAWFEVAKVFASLGYIPLCLHINAKYAGVAQNRPRFIMISVRRDYLNDIFKSFNAKEQWLFESGLELANLIEQNEEPEFGNLKCFDVEKQENAFKDTFLQSLIQFKGHEFSVKQAIDDLCTNNAKSYYVNLLNDLLGENVNDIDNFAPKMNSEAVQRRFRIYQVLTLVSKSTEKEVKEVLKGKELELSDIATDELIQFEFLFEDENELRKSSNGEEILHLLLAHKTKKQTQKALDPTAPAPAALSIPDDACHYDPLRTLTVREMARVQSFPDSFVFRSKLSTGGLSRRFEVPQYTQVGNAVPPLLGRTLGYIIKDLLNRN
ncbi:DNA (cytosine-5-)-methyltransferase [Vibrio lentus]|uniref:DNA cytosine methyltransferase n=1 Tax=Vibrio lentus TaxID=136468 RepID=UPI000C84DD87|nr:DNA cytosine methyltransferase [Vibrio lentus]MCC4817044.1 DNA cytosine methyltransferase [Vibrio lentus]PMG73410.1 DNA (cytosine-5-)-methyltransferase [Vibrio lentus]PML21938.1 DNA (cytosine-5-)-methyltransferase [Vibrio lentus]PMM29237.1 DNA (cytosine-5-)-methyltransferase [Vibrio lentus]